MVLLWNGCFIFVLAWPRSGWEADPSPIASSVHFVASCSKSGYWSHTVGTSVLAKVNPSVPRSNDRSWQKLTIDVSLWSHSVRSFYSTSAPSSSRSMKSGALIIGLLPVAACGAVASSLQSARCRPRACFRHLRRQRGNRCSSGPTSLSTIIAPHRGSFGGGLYGARCEMKTRSGLAV